MKPLAMQPSVAFTLKPVATTTIRSLAVHNLHRLPTTRSTTRSFSSTPNVQANYFRISLHRWRLVKDRSEVWLRRMVRRSKPPNSGAFKSLATRTAESASSRSGNDDLGLLPGTVIVRSFLFGRGAKNQPSFFEAPRALLSAEWKLIRRRFQDFLSLIVSWSLNGRPRLKIASKQLKKEAREKYEMQYKLFAEGRISELDAIVCEGLYSRYAEAIRRRSQSQQQLHWSLTKWKRLPTIVTDRALLLPDGMNRKGRESVVRQAVVRVRSLQDFTAGNGQLTSRDVTEYMVMQRSVIFGIEGPWKVQGFVEPPEWDRVENHFGDGQQSKSDEPAAA